MQLKSFLKGFVAFTALTTLLMASSCESDTTKQGVAEQETNMERAMTQTRVPQLDNFQTRRTVAKWLKRMDVVNKEFYIYVIAPMGQYMGYFVAEARHVNICTSMTPPVRRYGSLGDSPLGPAPGLDGVYYGGSGCDAWYFFDAATDAYIETKGLAHFITDQPLDIRVDQIKVAVTADAE